MRKDVAVKALMKPTGEIIPLSLYWDDQREFEIDKVLDIRPRASTRGGGMGVRYRIRIGQQERFLFLDGFVWFVEVNA